MFSRSELPTTGVLRIYVTCDRVTSESAENGSVAEMGWVDAVGSSTIYESRNDVEPVYEVAFDNGDVSKGSEYVDWEDALSALDDTIATLGAYESSDGSTLYGVDGHVLDYATDNVYNYAMHAHVKYFKPFIGYVEEDTCILP